MPLAFSSLSHGTVAFGFFNISTDMLLLRNRFFFADRFCAAVVALAAGGEGAEAELPCWRIDDPSLVGDLHGAIAGMALDGFIGATYRRWPFPSLPGDFKQDPDGRQTEGEMLAMIPDGAAAEVVPLRWRGREVSVGDTRFDLDGFAELIAYVDRGGYPRWRGERRPDYVAGMMSELRASCCPLFVK